MSLPQAVMKAEAEANAMIEAQNGNTDKASTPDKEVTQIEFPKQSETPQNETSPPQQEDPYKHKYEVLQGKFNKLAADMKALQEKDAQQTNPVSIETDPRYVQLQQQLSQLQQQNSQLMQTLESRPEPEAKVELDPYLVEEYGEEFAAAVAKTAAAQTKSAVEKLRQEFGHKIESTQNTVSQVTTTSSMNNLKKILSDQGIKFDLVNNDPEFHAYLMASDPFSGTQRQTLLENAFNSGDVERTARFFTDFVKTQNQTSSEHPLADHVDPSTNVVMQDTGSQQPNFDPDALTKLHDQFRRGLITEAEFQQKERSLFAALS